MFAPRVARQGKVYMVLCPWRLSFKPIRICVFNPAVIKANLIRTAQVVCYCSGSSAKTSGASLLTNYASPLGKCRLFFGHGFSL